MRKYEGLFIVPDTLKDDAVKAVSERLRSEVEKLGGIVDENVILGKRGFARPLKKREAGYYLRVAFRLDPDRVSAFEARYKLIEQVFRAQIVTAPAVRGVRKSAAPAAGADDPGGGSKADPANPVKEGSGDGNA